MSASSTDREIAEATEVFLLAFRTLVDGEEDDRKVPVGRLLQEFADQLGLSDDLDPEWYATAGEIRQRTRDGLAALAHGDTP